MTPESGMESSAPVAEEDATPPRVFVVEDDRVSRTLLYHLLIRRGYQVGMAADGREALRMIETEAPPDLVLTPSS